MPYADADLQSIDNFSIEGDNRITIEEIEQTTLEREITNREFRTDFKENDPNLNNTETRDESKGKFLIFNENEKNMNFIFDTFLLLVNFDCFCYFS